MKSYYKYLPVSISDENWGLTLLNLGFGPIERACVYPSLQHPQDYKFSWEQGRILTEYQLIYISGGSGIYESLSTGKIEIMEGSIILLFPGEWHRYRPDGETGWMEYWVGFKGKIVDNLVEQGFFRRSKPVLLTGVNPEIIKLYQDIVEYTRAEWPGYQPLVSGMIVHLLGLIHSLTLQDALSIEDKQHHQLIQKAKSIIREHIETRTTIEEIAEQLQMGYSLFRKVFKKHTGIAPGQYLIQLKIDRAKQLLVHTDKLIKEIAYDLNFESESYFSKFFKEKTGCSPAVYKKTVC